MPVPIHRQAMAECVSGGVGAFRERTREGEGLSRKERVESAAEGAGEVGVDE